MNSDLLELPVLTNATCGNPCDGCQSGCCRSFVVPLTMGDIFRIAGQTQLSFWDFVVRWDDREGLIARGQAPHFFFSDEPQTPFVIGLKHVDSQTFSGASKCRFLAEAADGACCGAYDQRPLTCRIFPTIGTSSTELGIAEIAAYGRAGTNPAYRLCTRAWQRNDLDWDVKQLEFQQCRNEMDVLRVIADRWNLRPGKWSVFPTFLEAIYERIAA